MAEKKEIFSKEEREAMRELVKERKRGGKGDGEADVLAKIAEMTPADRKLAKKVHEIVRATAPDLAPKTWYGFPAYADKDGKVVIHFQPAAKFNTRYATLGFSDKAKLDDGEMWPTVFALNKLTPADEKKITALVKKATAS
jgi:uncharacterized protein YdhG (YjbR/CyaY superfamily)